MINLVEEWEKFTTKWDKAVDCGIATDKEIGLVVRIVAAYISGIIGPKTTTDIIDAIVYDRTGFATLEDYVKSMDE